MINLNNSEPKMLLLDFFHGEGREREGERERDRETEREREYISGIFCS